MLLFVIFHVHGLASPRDNTAVFKNSFTLPFKLCTIFEGSFNNLLIVNSVRTTSYGLFKDVFYILTFAMKPYLFIPYVLFIVWPYFLLYMKGDADPWERKEFDHSYLKWRTFRARIW